MKKVKLKYCFLFLIALYATIGLTYISIIIQGFSLVQSQLVKSRPITILKTQEYVTVVSTFFKMPNSKHSLEEYDIWMTNMLKSVKAPLVAYVDQFSANKVNRIRQELGLKTTLVIYNNVWDLLKELELERNVSYSYEYLTNQHGKDPEHKIHNPNMYAIYTLKAFINQKVVTLNPYGSRFFIYTDAGAWRLQEYPDWPDITVVKRLEAKLNDRVLFGQIHNETNFTDLTKDIIQGTFYAGSRTALNNYANKFYQVHDRRLSEGWFVGKAQNTMNLITFEDEEYRKRNIVRLKTWNLNCSSRYDPWLFFQLFFSISDYYDCTQNRFSLFLD
jgi:hypothetical protein